MSLLLAILAALSSCGESQPPTDINKPIAEQQISSGAKFDDVNKIVVAFSEKNHFAVQNIISVRQGALDFSIRLYRDDITVTINRIHGDPIEVDAFPLCVCELNRRLGLQEAANDAVSELGRDLAPRGERLAPAP